MRLDDRVEALSTAAALLAGQIRAFEIEAWGRDGLRSGQPVPALQLVREAIHDGAHHLRTASDGLATMCTLPLDEHDDR